MSKAEFRGNRQGFLFAPSRQAIPVLDPDHYLVKMTDQLDWDELLSVAQRFRDKKLKTAAGQPPHLRQTVGAVVFMSIRHIPYRRAEDLIRHYTPARYMCGLTETDWTPDFTTIHDFTKLMGEDGIAALNEVVLGACVEANLCDPKVLVADTTCQETNMSYPTEVGLMAKFLATIENSSQTVGRAMSKFGKALKDTFTKGNQLLRTHRFFAKTKEARLAVTKKLVTLVKAVQGKLKKTLRRSKKAQTSARKNKKVAWQTLRDIHQTMQTLLPQIESWLKTGFVAKNKIVNLFLPTIRSIPRGKVGKTVEFGIKWGIRRLGGGFVYATSYAGQGNVNDQKDCLSSVEEHREMFGQAPVQFAYDRGGWSEENVEVLQEEYGVRHVGIAPKGRADWAVSARMKTKLHKERSRIEGDIGTLKHKKYGFNRPDVRSERMMTTVGQRSILGYNLNTMIRKLAERDETILVGY